jgi:putative pyruvate formate lyase activating enzyme
MMNDIYKNCALCPRNCCIDRVEGKRGFCGETHEIRAARAALHYWEEPCISGRKGSGAIFFTGCTMRCIFCQNHNIADGSVGRKISIERLIEIFFELKEKGANNINLVTADMFIPSIAEAIKRARDQGFDLPFLLNTSSYINVDTLKMLDGLIDIYLPDFKYMSEKRAMKYSSAPDYPGKAKLAIAEMYRQLSKSEKTKSVSIGTEGICYSENNGFSDSNINYYPENFGLSDSNISYYPKNIYFSDKRMDHDQDNNRRNMICRFTDHGIMTRGMIVRHLVMPGGTLESKLIIKYLYETYGDSIFLSIMNQYTPIQKQLEKYPELNRRVTAREYDEVINYALDLGVKNAYMQEGGAISQSFIPAFDYEGL